MSSTPRFFVPLSAVQGDLIVLPDAAAHHARAVLRLVPGDPLVVHDGTGMGYWCVLNEASGKASPLTASVQSAAPVQTEPLLSVSVVQALPKTADKMEQVLQHGTEIGASRFVFFPAFRSVARWDSRDKTEKRLTRWQQIVQSAAEQSGRGLLPEVAYLPTPQAVADFLPATANAPDAAAIVCHESAEVSLASVLKTLPPALTQLSVLIGPEGGFTPDEIALFGGAGAAPVSLGPRILRTETAALVAVSQILFARGG